MKESTSKWPADRLKFGASPSCLSWPTCLPLHFSSCTFSFAAPHKSTPLIQSSSVFHCHALHICSHLLCLFTCSVPHLLRSLTLVGCVTWRQRAINSPQLFNPTCRHIKAIVAFGAMAFWVYPTGHDMQNRLNNDSLGQLYLILACAWTFLLLCGIAFLIRNRKLPFLCMRKLPLGILAVASLHVYWVLCMLAYILNGYFACSMEYWIMSTYLPLGIALYQASNTQLLHVAGLQKQFTSSDLTCLQKHSAAKFRGWRRLLAEWHSFNPTRCALVGICMGMIAQVN